MRGKVGGADFEEPPETGGGGRFFCRNLSVGYPGERGETYALYDVSVEAVQGRITAVIGESGSGKSTLAKFFAGTLPGSARVECETSQLPGTSAFIEQEAAASLHPLLKVGTQLADCLRGAARHDGTLPGNEASGDARPPGKLRRREAAGRTGRRARAHSEVGRLLSEVGLEPKHTITRYPHQLSGGQAQRIAVARALAVGAEMLLADEPTAHVDLLVQRMVLRVLVDAVRRHGPPCLFVTHDLSIAEEIADHIAVLHEGRLVEEGPPERILYEPASEYTRQLVASTLGRGGAGPVHGNDPPATAPFQDSSGSRQTPEARASGRSGG
jgi:ABC-type glutathione transport system ATPase component